jgi:hypothetical protein
MRKYIGILSIFLFSGIAVFGQDVHTNVARTKLAEVYTTVSVIESSEEEFYLEKGHYASKHNDPQRPFYNLCNTSEENCRKLFSQILGCDIPQDSPFAYEVTDSPARISVYVKEAMDKGILCYKVIEGKNKGQWLVNNKHPWKDYLMIEGAQFYE